MFNEMGLSFKNIMLFCWLIVGFKQDQSFLSWDETHALSWSDFKAKPDGAIIAAAITASGITFGFSIKQTDETE